MHFSTTWYGHLKLTSFGLIKPYTKVCWLKTICGGWCTSYRMHDEERWPCIFGCPDCKDELKHYLICPILWQFPLPIVGMISSISIGERLCIVRPSALKLRALAITFFVYHSCRNDNLCRSAIAAVANGICNPADQFALVQSRAEGFAATAGFIT